MGHGDGNAQSPGECNFKPEDLSNYVVLLAERLYDKDFEAFGYQRLSEVRGLNKDGSVKESDKDDKLSVSENTEVEPEASVTESEEDDTLSASENIEDVELEGSVTESEEDDELSASENTE